jgi:hypothetical protein
MNVKLLCEISITLVERDFRPFEAFSSLVKAENNTGNCLKMFTWLPHTMTFETADGIHEFWHSERTRLNSLPSVKPVPN